jgi:hypothetical protein
MLNACCGIKIAKMTMSLIYPQEGGDNMSVQPISNSNQYVSALTSDFKTVQDDIKSLETAQSAGNQDQITLSQEALQKGMTQFQNDLASFTQGTQGTQASQGHHHHHHKADAANISTSGSDTTGSTIASLLTSAYGNVVQTKNNTSTINLSA